jgi:hypothetical protein
MADLNVHSLHTDRRTIALYRLAAASAPTHAALQVTR